MFMRQLKVPLDYFKGKNVLFKKWVESINDEICVFKKNEKIFFIYSNICPHNGGEFSLPDNEKVKCKWHGWEFNIIDGKCQTYKSLKCKINIYKYFIDNNNIIINLNL